jgi:signal transduction histidine kinase
MFALHAGLAIQNARLHQQVQELAIVDERLRISRDLHDGIIQGLYAVGLSLEDVPELIDEDQSEAIARVDRAIDRVHTTIGDIRTFIVGLDPTGETSIGDALVAQAHELTADSGVQMEVDLGDLPELERRLTPESGHQLLQIAREAISNVARHSRASVARVALHLQDGAVVLRVEDDGVGFDPEGQPGPGHFGLANLRDRAAGLGGELRIDSGPQKGTRIILTVPLVPLENAS